ncbi:hypothetical protein SSX86_022950 [Deinandra increscens subsp. villosa]|uniref:Seven-in-absentia protein TRAF-like domain-containing protein n=1 Tax=Deinandra increscens subsp. villosa TaxID=3103831 RepID=A0AAP0GSZ6_9ASTR
MGPCGLLYADRTGFKKSFCESLRKSDVGRGRYSIISDSTSAFTLKHFSWEWVYMAFLRFMGDEADACNYSYSLEVAANGRKLTCEGTPRSIRDSHRKVRDSHDGLIIQRNMALFFSGGDRKELKFRVTGVEVSGLMVFVPRFGLLGSSRYGTRDQFRKINKSRLIQTAGNQQKDEFDDLDNEFESFGDSRITPEQVNFFVSDGMLQAASVV